MFGTRQREGQACSCRCQAFTAMQPIGTHAEHMPNNDSVCFPGPEMNRACLSVCCFAFVCFSKMQQLCDLSEENIMLVSVCHSTVTVWPFDSLRLTSWAVSGELPAVGCRQPHFQRWLTSCSSPCYGCSWSCCSCCVCLMRHQHATKQHHASKHGESACTVQIVRVQGHSSQQRSHCFANVTGSGCKCYQAAKAQTCPAIQKPQVPATPLHLGIVVQGPVSPMP